MWWERNYPRLFALGALAAYCPLAGFKMLGLPISMIGPALSVATLAVGFAGTIGVLLLTLPSPVITVLQRRDAFRGFSMMCGGPSAWVLPLLSPPRFLTGSLIGRTCPLGG
jgi:hypothetical protein